MKKIILFLFSVALFASCVSSRQFNETNANLQACLSEKRLQEEENQKLTVGTNELKGSLDRLKNELDQFRQKHEVVQFELENTRRNNQRIHSANQELENQLEVLKSGSSKEISTLMEKLQSTQSDIQSREDRLRQAESELQSKNQRLGELQDALSQKDEAVKNLKQKVIAALTGFNNNGLSIAERNGKVYVSMDEKLLFKSAQWVVDEKGKQALRNLSDLLAINPEINILVEGHTDDVPMRGSGDVKDNWDLSVMRATAVTKILLENKSINPQRISASGRSEFLPVVVGQTNEDRQKNRRTEIILSPRLDEIFKLLEGN